LARQTLKPYIFEKYSKEEILARLRNAVSPTTRGKLIYERNSFLSGYPTKDVIYSNPLHVQMRVRIILEENNVFALIAISDNKKNLLSDEKTLKFINSFSLKANMASEKPR